MVDEGLHEFGGPWTSDKLVAVSKYIRAYRVIFERQAWATTWYAEAFSGSGTWADKNKGDGFRLAGSAKLALGLPSPFHHYLFVEKDPSKAESLKRMAQEEHPSLIGRVRVVSGDGPTWLKTWMDARDWRRERAVVFLDPYAMAVPWSLVQSIAATGAIDLWYLFPLGAWMRCMPHKCKPDPAWAERLRVLLGDPNWEQSFYAPNPQLSLFGAQEDHRVEDWPGAKAYLVRRFEATGFKHVLKEPAVLRGPHGAPLFLLTFASPNKAALKIAEHLTKGLA